MMLLGIRIDELNNEQIFSKISDFLKAGQHTIFTPNPEMLVAAQKDDNFKAVLNRGELNICDGRGTELAAKLFGKRITRLPGVDLMKKICSIAEKDGVPVYLLGGAERSVVRGCSEQLLKEFPALKIAGYDEGFDIVVGSELKYDDQKNTEELEKIRRSKAAVLFVAFGMIKQERWILQNLEKIPDIRLAMGVGGSFDYISGRVPRAPLLMQKIGLEWSYRLAVQPERLSRILNATIRFSYLTLKQRLKI